MFLRIQLGTTPDWRHLALISHASYTIKDQLLPPVGILGRTEGHLGKLFFAAWCIIPVRLGEASSCVRDVPTKTQPDRTVEVGPPWKKLMDER